MNDHQFENAENKMQINVTILTPFESKYFNIRI